MAIEYRDTWIGAVNVLAHSRRAVKVEYRGKEAWIPRSRILEGSRLSYIGEHGSLVIPLWLAKAKGYSDSKDRKTTY